MQDWFCLYRCPAAIICRLFFVFPLSMNTAVYCCYLWPATTYLDDIYSHNYKLGGVENVSYVVALYFRCGGWMGSIRIDSMIRSTCCLLWRHSQSCRLNCSANTMKTCSICETCFVCFLMGWPFRRFSTQIRCFIHKVFSIINGSIHIIVFRVQIE